MKFHLFVQRLTRNGRFLPLLITLIFIGVLFLPYYLGYTFVPSGQAFTGILMNPEDSQTYFAKMLQGYDGQWLYTIPFTAEPHEPALVGVFYVWLGQVARLTGLSLTAVWHLSRIIAQIILSLTTYWFVAAFTKEGSERWTAYLLALFGSGLGWVLFLWGQPYWLDAFPVDFKQPGAHLFFTALTYPHITLGTALILFSVWGLWRLQEKSSWRLALALGLAHILLGIAYPFLLYLVALVAVLLYLSKWIAEMRRESAAVDGEKRKKPGLFASFLSPSRSAFFLPLTGQYAIAFLIPLPLYIYFAYVLYTNEVFAAWDVQAATLSAPWPHYLLAYGPMLLLGALHLWRRPSERTAVTPLWMWVLAVALLLYAPLNPQRRFVQGVHVPLAILATLGLLRVILPWLTRSRPWQKLVQHPRYSSEGLAKLLIAGFLFVMSLSNLYIIASVSLSATLQPPDLLFRPLDEVTAVAWLRENGLETAVLLGDYQTGNYVAAQAGQHVVLGHWAETVAYEQKVADVARFYAADTPETWRQQFLQAQHVAYVWYGPREQALGGFDPETAVYLQPIYANTTITIYSVDQTP